MATENIVTGKKYRILKDATNKIWDVMSFWGKAKDVEFDDGKNAETKLGNIQGITSSLASDSSSIAASANAVKLLNDKITKLNSDTTAPMCIESFRAGSIDATVLGRLILNTSKYKTLSIDNITVTKSTSSNRQFKIYEWNIKDDESVQQIGGNDIFFTTPQTYDVSKYEAICIYMYAYNVAPYGYICVNNIKLS